MGNVRLSARQSEALAQALDSAHLPLGSKVYLFGSRTDMNAAGGDVDLLVSAPRADRYDVAKRIRREYHRIIGERIDIIVVDPEHPDPAQEAFLRTVTKVPVR